MEFKLGDWEVSRNFLYDIRKASNGDKNYICKGPICKETYSKINWYDKFKIYDLPLLTIVETLLYKDKFYFVYKEAAPIRSIKDFSAEKIIIFIIEMAKFHYETGYCVVTNINDLFIRNGEIYFNPCGIEQINFSEKYYLSVALTIFYILNNREMYKKIKYIEYKDFDDLKKSLLSCLIVDKPSSYLKHYLSLGNSLTQETSF